MIKHTGQRTLSVFCAVILAVISVGFTCPAGAETAPSFQYPYGVFLSVCENIGQFADYETVVIDAQYYTKEELDDFRNRGHKVFSYINIGSLEDFRGYYDEYKDLSLGAYEHWEEEVWVDVSSPRWQELILDTVAAGLLEKDIDGFFVDNCDVYYIYPKEEILDGLGVIMKRLVQTGKKVIINGGDTFLDAWNPFFPRSCGMKMPSVRQNRRTMNTLCPT